MKLIKTLPLILTLVLFSACDSLLDVDPQQSISEETALSTPQNVQAALIGAYSSFRGSSAYGGNYIYLTDLLADDDQVVWSGTFFQPRQVWTKDIETDNSFVANTWAASYNTINRVNNVLGALEVLDAADRPRVEGESKFIRGAVYFNLVRIYGKAWNDGNPSDNLGVPLITTPTREIDETSNVPRASVAAIYAQAIQDLTDARDLLPNNNGVFASSMAASAMLARIYLIQGNYEQAAVEADRVISSGQFSLMGNYEAVFNRESNSSEDIFSIQVSASDGGNDMRVFYASTGNGGRGDIDIQQSHLDLYEDGDARLDLFYLNLGVHRTGKWRTLTNISVLRLAEMYLTRAEANFRLGRVDVGDSPVGDTPLNDINRIRERVNLDPHDELTLEDIRIERHLELAFEGHFLSDFKRFERTISGLPFNSPRLVFPIPQREMDVNDQLVQNDGYSP